MQWLSLSVVFVPLYVLHKVQAHRFFQFELAKANHDPQLTLGILNSLELYSLVLG